MFDQGVLEHACQLAVMVGQLGSRLVRKVRFEPPPLLLPCQFETRLATDAEADGIVNSLRREVDYVQGKDDLVWPYLNRASPKL